MPETSDVADRPGGTLVERPDDCQPAVVCADDALGQVTSLRTPDDLVTFDHDGLGRRVTRTSRSGTAVRIFDGASVIAEVHPDPSVTLETVAGLLVLRRQGPTDFRRRSADRIDLP